ncbi:Beta-defensin 122 [Myotis brandtii]|uniref:Beta-defensin n=1 Tax=Myotis brandtii TaxID=109478 RepID=S7NFX7_MYOBR|nr:Beta-defensin 122 [Myotis brandtii]
MKHHPPPNPGLEPAPSVFSSMTPDKPFGCSEFQCSTEKCWNLHGNCREECHKDETVFIFCPSGKLCCVKPKFQPKITRQRVSG